MNIESDKRELVKALEACLRSADDLGLSMAGIYISHAIDYLNAEDALEDRRSEKMS